MRAIATEACRQAMNDAELLSRVRDEVGFPLAGVDHMYLTTAGSARTAFVREIAKGITGA